MPEQLFGFAAAFAAGCIGFGLLRLIRFPAAAIMGSMVATGFLNVMGWAPHFNSGTLSYVCTVGIGILVARQLNRRIFGKARSMVRPVLVQISCHMLLSLACGYIFYRLVPHSGESAVALVTALVSTSTGGLTEMLVFGLSVGGDVSVIAFVQLIRVITFQSLIPYSGKLAKRLGDKRMSALSGSGGSGPGSVLPSFSRRNYLLLVVLAFIGGYIGLSLRVPAGSLLGSMCFAGALGMFLNKTYNCKPIIRNLAQIGLGMAMGQRVDAQMLLSLGGIILPVLGITAVMLAGCLALAFLQYKTTRYDLATCLFCAAPAGLSLVAVLADEAGTDVFTVSVFHTARIVSVVIIYPWVILHLI